MMEPMELDPMAMIEAQRDRIRALIDENVQLTAAVSQLQQMIEQIHTEQHELEMARNGEVTDITDELIGAEVTV